jgi:hypothetical protein
MGRRIDGRMQQKRREDHSLAERVDLAALTARAFNLRAAKNYLRLSGVQSDLIESFASRYPDNNLRSPAAERTRERRSGLPNEAPRNRSAST